MKIKRLIPICALVIMFFSCGNDSYNGTPAKFKSFVKINNAVYVADKNQTYSIIKKMINAKINPFDIEEYDDNTNVFIDTLIYSPDQKMLIAFIITKNSIEKLLRKENNEKYYYNANYLFCLKNNIEGKIGVFDYAGFNLVNFYSYNEIKEALHDYCFYRLFGESTRKNIHYNLDDVRFWKSKDFEMIIKNSKVTQIP
jgi:hypothetical protein